MNTLPRMLLDVIDSGYWIPRDWQGWSDNEIRQQGNSSSWIIQLSLASTQSEATSVIREHLAHTEFVDGINHKDIVLGYMRLIHMEGRITTEQLLARAWNETEPPEDTGSIKNDEIFDLYKEVELAINDQKNIKNAEAKVESIFSACSDIAAHALALISQHGHHNKIKS